MTDSTVIPYHSDSRLAERWAKKLNTQDRVALEGMRNSSRSINEIITQAMKDTAPSEYVAPDGDCA